jgi:hypothetical protein
MMEIQPNQQGHMHTKISILEPMVFGGVNEHNIDDMITELQELKQLRTKYIEETKQ